MLLTTQLDRNSNRIYALADDVERYRVPGGTCVAIDLVEGDSVKISTPEGLQTCEIVPFDLDGGSAPSLFDQTATIAPRHLLQILAGGEYSHLRDRLARRSVHVSGAKALLVLDESSRAGDEVTLSVKRSGLVVFGAPANSLQSRHAVAPSDLVLTITKTLARRENQEREVLPDPLGDIRDEFRIQASGAIGYTVKAGEFIQVIDVRGRQCSDFVAFSARALDAGEVVGMSDTATRSRMGLTVPVPGLHSKLFDDHSNAMLEIVQDTVGKHDTFLNPCTSFYYDEIGYPGHINCTDNLNDALADYGIKRDVFSAFNLFMNAEVDEGNVLIPDMSWSRAGDYVVFKAHQDMVIGTSACPSDIDPVNGWNPTDIHVRVYNKESKIKRAVATPLNRMGDKTLTAETSFHERTSALCKKFLEYKGFWVPAEYQATGARREYWACREAATIADMSALRKFEVVGPGAERLMNWAVTRDVTRMAVGDVVYTAMCHVHGAIVDDGTLFRMTDQNFRWICNEDQTGDWLRAQAEALRLEAWVKASTANLHNLAVQGPNSLQVLLASVWTPPNARTIGDLKTFQFTVGRVLDHEGPPVVVSRTGYTGKRGYEVFCHPDQAVAVWDVLMEKGEPLGLVPMGLSALDMLRIECGFPFTGAEFGGDVDPFEAGIGFVVSAKKEGDFSGKEALSRRRQERRMALVGIELGGDRVPDAGMPVYHSMAEIGHITSATFSPAREKVIALARVNMEFENLTEDVSAGKSNRQASRMTGRIVNKPFVSLET
ncbi:MAG: DUF1989 domain-containing protein [Pseudomonadota bacterium]